MFTAAGFSPQQPLRRLGDVFLYEPREVLRRARGMSKPSWTSSSCPFIRATAPPARWARTEPSTVARPEYAQALRHPISRYDTSG
jgi:hypothetical protein